MTLSMYPIGVPGENEPHYVPVTCNSWYRQEQRCQ
jgi:hypothetical protein